MASIFSSIATPPIQTQSVTSASTATTTSGTDALMTGMTITPIAGTYFAIFTGGIQQNIAGDSITVSIYSGGSIDSSSTVAAAPFAGGTLTSGQSSAPWTVQGVYTVNGAQAITVEWHVSGGTGSVGNRKLTIMRIG